MIIKKNQLPQKTFTVEHDLTELYKCKELMVNQMSKAKSDVAKAKAKKWLEKINSLINQCFDKAS